MTTDVSTPAGRPRHARAWLAALIGASSQFWEEVHYVHGSLHELTVEQTFTVGMNACRPPSMPHGPWISSEGRVTFEVRLPA